MERKLDQMRGGDEEEGKPIDFRIRGLV